MQFTHLSMKTEKNSKVWKDNCQQMVRFNQFSKTCNAFFNSRSLCSIRSSRASVVWKDTAEWGLYNEKLIFQHWRKWAPKFSCQRKVLVLAKKWWFPIYLHLRYPGLAGLWIIKPLNTYMHWGWYIYPLYITG
jgi:hypothetical protein